MSPSAQATKVTGRLAIATLRECKRLRAGHQSRKNLSNIATQTTHLAATRWWYPRAQQVARAAREHSSVREINRDHSMSSAQLVNRSGIFNVVEDSTEVDGARASEQRAKRAVNTCLGVPRARSRASTRVLQSTKPTGAAKMEEFTSANESSMADDHAGAPAFLARNSWHLDTAKKDWPKVRFLEVKEQAWNS